MKNMKRKIRPLYAELQGYLSQASKKEGGQLFEKTLQEQVNGTIDELNETSKSDYNRFKIQNKTINWNGIRKGVVDISEYKSKLAGLINRLYG